jgi:hypothetical protein
MNVIQISDPNAHTHYNCFVLEEPHVCVLTRFAPSTSAVYKEPTPPTGALPDGMGSAVHEELGKQFLAGVETSGVRDSIIYNPGVFGNDRKMSVERESGIPQNWESTCCRFAPIRDLENRPSRLQI